jgi:hypothetical protein
VQGIVESIEGEYYIVEIDGKTEDIHKSQVDSSVEVNDVITLVDGKWVANENITRERSKVIKKMMNDLWTD